MQVHPNLMPYIQNISNAVIQQAQGNRTNPARNHIAMMATNPAFLQDVVGTVCDFITLNIGKGVVPGFSWGNIDYCINDAVGRVLTMYTSLAIQRNDNGIANQVAPEVVREAAMHVQQFAAFVNEVNAMKTASGMPYQPMQQQPYGMQPQQQYVPNQFQSPAQNQRVYQPAQVQTFQPVRTPDNYFSAQATSSGFEPVNQSTTGRQYFAPKPQQQVQTPAPVFEQEPPKPEVPQEPTHWFGSEIQPYQPIFRKSTDSYKLEWRPGEKQQLPFITIINGVPMDRQKHETAFQGVRLQSNEHDMFDGAEVSLARTSSEPVVTAEDEAIDQVAAALTTVDNSVAYQSSSLQEAILKTDVIFQKEKKASSKKSVMTLNLITTPMVTDKNYFELLGSLSQCQTIKQLIIKIKRVLAVQKQSRSAIERLFNRLDIRLTQEFNALLRTRLCVDTLSATSFVDDCEDIVEYLRDNYGVTYANALEKIEEEFIQSTFCAIDSLEEHNDYIESAVKSDLLEDGVAVTFFSSYCTITRVEANSATLDVGFVNEKLSGFITGSKHRELLALSVNIFERIKQDFSDMFIAHHYLVTSDDKIYELHESAITGNDYLISYVGDYT